MINYVRVRIQLYNDKTAILWAIKKDSKPYCYFTKIDKYGNEMRIPTFYVADEKDIIWEKPARMNKKYAELEIVQD